MRIIDYFNIFAAILYFLVVLLCILKKPAFLYAPADDVLKPRWEALLFTLLLGLGILLRFYRLAVLPEGMHQDEASNIYEAFSLSNYGIDRNGYTYPVYPITWGSGGGNPILIYSCALLFKFIEPSILAYRCVFAFLGSLTLILFYLFIRRVIDKRAALIGMGALAVMPWHVVLSRWGLDSNTIPFFCMLVLLLFLYANETKKTGLYLLTAFVSGLCLYCYGSATIAIPLFLLFSCTYSLWMKRLSIRQLIYSGIIFLLTVLPLATFYFINLFDLPAITTPWFSIPRFTGRHPVFLPLNASLPLNLLKNVLHLLQMLTVGVKDELWNYVPGYFTLYHFTFPLTFLGLFSGFKKVIQQMKTREYNGSALMGCMLISALLFSLSLQQNINRMVFVFLPLIYFFILGICTVGQYSRYLLGLVILLLGMGSFSFVRDYFVEYGPMSNYLFMKGYGDAIAYAESVRREDQLVYSTYEGLASPFITALVYSRTSPHDYLETAVYKSEDAEFKVAVSFTCYRFGLPLDIEEEHYYEHILIIAASEKDRFEDLPYRMTQFDNYVVLEYDK